MPTVSQLEELVDELDGERSAVAVDGLERFGDPARGAAGPLAVVVLPRSTDQVRSVVSWARRHGIRLLPQGANTGLVGASTPGREGGVVVVSTEHLRGVPIIDPIDRTVVVPAGLRLSELNEHLEPHGLELAIDLGADPSIGGMVATNTGGARMLRHGDMGSHVLGVEAVIADEECSVVDELSVLRKDNTGLDLSHLFVGSGGALGVITRVALEVEPIARDRACAWVAPAGAQAALQALVSLEHEAGEWLSAYEVISRAAMVPALELVDGLRRPFGSPKLPELSALVEFEGRRGAQDALVDALAVLDSAGLITDAVVGPPQEVWAVRHSISEGLRRSGTIIGFDVSVPRSALPQFLATVRPAVTDLLSRVIVADFGHWGDGGVHCSVVVPFDEPLSRTEIAELRDLVFGLVVHDFAGSFSAEHGLGPANSAWWEPSTSPGSVRLSRAIKRLCDPLDLLGHPDLPYS